MRRTLRAHLPQSPPRCPRRRGREGDAATSKNRSSLVVFTVRATLNRSNITQIDIAIETLRQPRGEPYSVRDGSPPSGAPRELNRLF